MPKIGLIPKTSATVLFYDTIFNFATEGGNTFDSVNPANRWRSFASRHTIGGVVNFIDCHVEYVKTKVATNGGTMSGNPMEYDGTPLIWNPPYRQQHP
jgi:hypothetical protein